MPPRRQQQQGLGYYAIRYLAPHVRQRGGMARETERTQPAFFTDQKKIQASEMRLFLDYVYVSMLDAFDLDETQFHLDAHQ